MAGYRLGELLARPAQDNHPLGVRHEVALLGVWVRHEWCGTRRGAPASTTCSLHGLPDARAHDTAVLVADIISGAAAQSPVGLHGRLDAVLPRAPTLAWDEPRALAGTFFSSPCPAGLGLERGRYGSGVVQGSLRLGQLRLELDHRRLLGQISAEVTSVVVAGALTQTAAPLPRHLGGMDHVPRCRADAPHSRSFGRNGGRSVPGTALPGRLRGLEPTNIAVPGEQRVWSPALGIALPGRFRSVPGAALPGMLRG